MTKALDNNDVCATVRIHVQASKGNPDGILEINKTDYDAAKHQLVDSEQPALNLTAPPAVPFASAPFAPAPAINENAIVGSNVLPAMLDVGASDELSLGFVVGLAHSKSGLDIATWNALPDDQREANIAAELALIREANGYKPGPFDK